MPMFRIVNVTNHRKPPGYFLDTGEQGGNRLIGVGKSLMINAQAAEELPEYIQKWLARGEVRVFESTSGKEASASSGYGELTPATVSPVREASAQMDDVDDFTEPDFDLNAAQEAALPEIEENTAPILGDLRQTHGRNAGAKVSLGLETSRLSPSSNEISPIPGDRPRELGNASQFTVKAGQSAHPGRVISGK